MVLRERGKLVHYVHAILVEVPEDPDAGPQEVLQIAFDAIEPFGDGRVWDWHAGGPGRWADEVPAVLFGRDNRFEKYRQAPLENALEHLRWAAGREWEWRTEEEIEAGGFQVFPNDLNGHIGRKGKPVYWSARPEPDSWKLEELVRKLWNSGERLDLWGFHMTQAVALADGEYRSDAHFYSMPDCSTKVSLDTLGAVQEHPERFALVFVDLHN